MKNLLPFILFVLLTFASAYAQSKTELLDVNKETVFTIVEEQPLFKGGKEAMYAFIKKIHNIRKRLKMQGSEAKFI